MHHFCISILNYSLKHYNFGVGVGAMINLIKLKTNFRDEFLNVNDTFSIFECHICIMKPYLIQGNIILIQNPLFFKQ